MRTTDLDYQGIGYDSRHGKETFLPPQWTDHPASYQMCNGDLYPGGKRPGREAYRMELYIQSVLRFNFLMIIKHWDSFIHWAGQDFTAICRVLRLTVGWTVWGSNPGGAGVSAPAQTGRGAHPVSYEMGTGSLFRGYSCRCWGLTTHSHLAPRLKKEKSYTSVPPVDIHGLL